MKLNTTVVSTTFADDFAAALELRKELAVIAPLNSSALIAYSHELAPRLGVSHKRLKRDIEEVMEELGYDPDSQWYTYTSAKGREKVGYWMDMEMLLNIMTGCDVGRMVDELMQPAEWEEDVTCHTLPH